MLVWLFDRLSVWCSGFHVFQYVTLRAVLSVLTALVVSLLLGPKVIRALAALKVGQTIRGCGPESHLKKSGTPTMGGTLILIAISLSTLLWANLNNRYVWVVLLVTLSFGAIGFWDDYRKIVYRNSEGLRASWKYAMQSVVACIAALFLYHMASSPVETALIVPFFKQISVSLGMFYVVFSYFVIVGTSNAVNLTDGLDGLAILPTVLVAGALTVFAYVTGHAEFARYLAVPYVSGVSEVVIVSSAIVGAGLGFLWFNTYPAQVFMGDVGSLALGAALGTLAVIVRQELVLCVMGGVFVLETVSVIVQVASFKLTGKRVFKMAPLHHHFELLGWPEPRIIVRFWIVTLILVLCGLATLKLR